MAKSPRRTSFFAQENQRTHRHIHAENGRGIMSRRDGIVKNGDSIGVVEIVLSVILAEQRRYIFHTVFEAFANGWDSFPRRFSRNAANMALARAGKSRCIRSMR
jgi:hypothetical protein